MGDDEGGGAWTLRLTPAEPVTVEPASAAATIEAALARLGPGPVAWTVALGEDMAREIVTRVPDHGTDRLSLRTLRMGTESAVLRILLRLAGVRAAPVTDEALEGGRDFARRGIPLDKVLRGVRLGHAIAARAFADEIRVLVPPAEQAEVMSRTSEATFEFIDGFASRLADAYLAEHERWMAGAAAVRRETVQAILAGEGVDAATASQDLGYPLGGEHLALTAWTEDPALADAGAARLHQVAVDLLRRRGCATTLVVPTGRTALWAWGTPGKGRIPQGSSEVPEGGGVRVAVGAPRVGLDGFRRSHQDALRVARVVGVSPHLVVADHAEAGLVALMCEDMAGLRAFVGDELGPLADDTAQAAQLRTTLLHYLRGERSLAAAAAQVHVARNTVTYRVNRARQLLGHDISHRRFEVHAALEAAHLLGDAVLRRADGLRSAE
ncbi:PucR family transcriptional regulator [Actinocorallia sp. A-T 12471]|uniref:PucR family transcriptional regulator n=1 Tax=Actinocorallia sp. A-T 12471 TaxID=3089813 RepID=UPI0029CF81F7|nr:helix-turn-helix domain-containing protein [Actinocorallia sp. A-T 12471]MDX6743959.1 helix-turn-helix domain-containing protein [Actinocorallia sp. A-T 12471]